MDRPDCDTRQAGTRSAGLGKATDYFDWRLLTVATHRNQYQGASFGCRQEGLGGSLAGRSRPVEAGSRSPRRQSAAVL
jgi:hypothetical protein